MSIAQLHKEIRLHAKKKRAKANAWFFKTGKGEYGEGDTFLGLTMPEQRKVAKKFKDLPLSDVEKLLKRGHHEERMVALLVLVHQYEAGDAKVKKEIYDFYITNRRNINNWDLVDVTTPRIVGNYLRTRNKDLLYRLARSKNLWDRRIAILATFPCIKDGTFVPSLKVAKMLLGDKEDLLHKAVGWMLREIGKQDGAALEKFLKENIRKLPRTTLRYAIERFPEKKRKTFLGM